MEAPPPSATSHAPRFATSKSRGGSGAAYVSIRQHASAYVSMRQHTSAYLSVCGAMRKRRHSASPSGRHARGISCSTACVDIRGVQHAPHASTLYVYVCVCVCARVRARVCLCFRHVLVCTTRSSGMQYFTACSSLRICFFGGQPPSPSAAGNLLRDILLPG